MPVQQPHPPIWVAARDPNSHEFAVANGCNVQVTPLHLGDEEVVNLMGHFNAAALLGTLGAVEMALQARDIPHGSGGVAAAVASLAEAA